MYRRASIAVAGALLLLFGPSQASPQGDVWQADVRVQSLDVTAFRGQLAAAAARGAQQITARIVIASGNDDDARAVRVNILLPIGAGVLRLPPGCHASASAVSTLAARVTCELGDIPVRGLREISITASSPASGEARFAVFVHSDTPDPVPSNNYSERVAP